MAVVAQCYVEGRDHPTVDDVGAGHGHRGISSSQVSEMAKSLDAVVETSAAAPSTAAPAWAPPGRGLDADQVKRGDTGGTWRSRITAGQSMFLAISTGCRNHAQ